VLRNGKKGGGETKRRRETKKQTNAFVTVCNEELHYSYSHRNVDGKIILKWIVQK
jgi:hypothetical protein